MPMPTVELIVAWIFGAVYVAIAVVVAVCCISEAVKRKKREKEHSSENPT